MLIDDLCQKEQKLDQELKNKLIQLDELSGRSKFLKLRESIALKSNEFDNDFYSSIDSHRDLHIEVKSSDTPPLDSPKKFLCKSHLVNANRLTEIAKKNEL